MSRLRLHPELRIDSEYCRKSRGVNCIDWAQERSAERRRLALILWMVCLLVGIVTGVAVSAMATDAAAMASVVFGTVLDERGVPVGPGTVSVFSDEYSLVRIGQIEDDGSYTVECDPGVSLLRYEISGFHPETRTVAAGPQRAYPLDVVVGPATSTIAGVVVDPVGVPVESARVVLFSQSQSTCVASVQTYDGGRFCLDVAAGDYIVSAWTGALAFRPEPVSTAGNERAEIVLVGVPADVRISGWTCDEQANIVSEVKVSAYTHDGRFVASVLSDSSGNYALYLPAGTWEIKAWKNGWTHTGTEVTIEHGRLQVSHDLVLQRSDSCIAGIVFDGDGKPLPNVWIEVTEPMSGNWAATALTDESGRFSLEIAGGVWDLSFMAEGRERTCVRVDAVPSDAGGLAGEPDRVAQRLVPGDTASGSDAIAVHFERIAK